MPHAGVPQQGLPPVPDQDHQDRPPPDAGHRGSDRGPRAGAQGGVPGAGPAGDLQLPGLGRHQQVVREGGVQQPRSGLRPHARQH